MTQIVPISDLSSATRAELRGGVITIGNFDGVHRGHRSLLEQTQRLAGQLGGPTIACLFDPHPIAILRPELAPKRLTSVAQRAHRMTAIGIDFLVVCQTSRELLEFSAEQFFQTLVCDNLDCRGVVEGENFCFGKDRRGDVALLAELCRKNGIEFRVAQMQSTDGEMISSTRIRDALSLGDVAAAAQMMGAPHRITGTVVHGDARGRLIGFPTANLHQSDVVTPAPGVYAATAEFDHQPFAAAVHIGESPTFESGSSDKVEVHLIGFEGDLYGQELKVDFIKRIRGIIRFESADALVAQLKQDLRSTEIALAQLKGNQE